MKNISVFMLILATIDGFLVVPEDVPAALAAIYGFNQPLHIGNDNRFGFGFRLGNVADFQLLYEFGPQTVTKPLKIRSAPYRPRLMRRQPSPLVDFFLRVGLLKDSSYYDNYSRTELDEPR